MSSVGSPITTSLVQAAQAQQVAAKARDRERAAAESDRRRLDQVELRVNGVVHTDAVRRLPQNDWEQAEAEHRREAHERPKPPPGEKDGERPTIDVKA